MTDHVYFDIDISSPLIDDDLIWWLCWTVIPDPPFNLLLLIPSVLLIVYLCPDIDGILRVVVVMTGWYPFVDS